MNTGEPETNNKCQNRMSSLPSKCWMYGGLLLLTALMMSGCRSFLPPRRTDLEIDKCRIEVSPEADSDTVEAARDLQGHLRQLSGSERPEVSRQPTVASEQRGFTFYVGQPPRGAVNAAPGQSARGAYHIDEKSVYFWRTPVQERDPGEKRLPERRQLPPLQAAINTFLQRELGWRWLAPEKIWAYAAQPTGQKYALRLGKVLAADLQGRVIAAANPALDDAAKARQGQWLMRFGHLPGVIPCGVNAIELNLLPLPLGTAASLYERAAAGTERRSISCLNGTPGALVGRQLRDYALLWALRDDAPAFETLMTHYTKAFGPAEKAVREYYEYWISHYRNVVSPDLTRSEPLSTANVPRTVYRHAGELYPPAAVEKAGTILDQAATHNLSSVQKSRLDHLLLSHEHLQMLLEVLRTLDAAEENPRHFAEGLDHALRLRDFRREFAARLGPAAPAITEGEKGMADITGLNFAELFESENVQPFMRLGPEWFMAPAGTGQADMTSPADVSTEEVRSWPVWFNEDKGRGIVPGGADSKSRWLAVPFEFTGDIFKNRYALNFWALACPATVYLNGEKIAEMPAAKFVDTPFAAWRVELPREVFDVAQQEQTLVVELTTKVRLDPVSVWRAVWVSEKQIESTP